MTYEKGPAADDSADRDPETNTTAPKSDITDRRPVDLGGYALGLAAADLPVFPLLPRSKAPRFGGSFHHATTDPNWIDRHWYYHPQDNIGVRPPLGMVVLDIDPRHGGDARMRELVDRHGLLPKTWVARTGGGGWHYWLVVGEMDDIRAHPWPGVDLKHGGTGFVVGPLSVHPDGGRYEWLVSPFGSPATAPEWVREAIRREPVHMSPPTGAGHGRYSLHCLTQRITAAPVGTRNTTAFGAMRDAARQGDLDAFEDTLAAAAIASGLDPAEVAAIVRSARLRGI